jgi:hypothetical protein
MSTPTVASRCPTCRRRQIAWRKPRVLDSISPVEGPLEPHTSHPSAVARARVLDAHVHPEESEYRRGWSYAVCTDPSCISLGRRQHD